MSPVSPVSPGSPPCSCLGIDLLERVCTLLRSAGWSVQVLTAPCCGEDDVRLCVSGSGRQLAVELLCATADTPAAEHWTAVRVQRGDRIVWQGPRMSDAPAPGVRFVEDLLLADLGQLHDRYRMLG